MILIPAIDLLNGQVVRLKQGDYNQKTVYSNDPVAVAERFVTQGAKWLHVVDLDGARTGKMKNLPLILEIRKQATVKMQVGGGIRSIESVDYLLKSGIDRVVLGTRALEDTAFLQEAIKRFGFERIAVSLGVKNGVPMVKGWVRPLSLRGAKRRSNRIFNLKRDCFATIAMPVFQRAGASYVIFTDISRDGMRASPNFEDVRKVQEYGFKVIASGGVASVKDVRRLEDMGVYGCIVGRAVYEDEEFWEKIKKVRE